MTVEMVAEVSAKVVNSVFTSFMVLSHVFCVRFDENLRCYCSGWEIFGFQIKFFILKTFAGNN